MRVAVCGTTGAGKTTWAKAIANEDVAVYHLITPIRALLMRCGVTEPTRHGLASITDRLRGEVGQEALAVMAVAGYPAVIEGVRLPAEATYLQAHGYTIVFVDTPANVRASRRGSDVGSMLFEDDAKAIKDMADWVVTGTSSRADIYLIAGQIRSDSLAA